MKLGIMLPQEWHRQQTAPVEAYKTMTRVAQEAERLGLTSVWLFDHLLSTTSSQQANQFLFECWMCTAALARDTIRIRLGQMVICNGFRHPALLAKMASTVDVLSHDRLDLGIGAGWYEQEYLASGYPFPDQATRLRQLREALQIIKAMWTEEEASFEGSYYQVRGAINQPKGVQQPHIPLLIGGKGEQVTLKLVARYADACNFTHPSAEELEHKFALLDRYCQEIGRDANAIRRTIYVHAVVAETDAEAIAQTRVLPGKFSLEHVRQRGLLGSPATVRQRLHELEQLGVQEIVILLHDVLRLEPLRLLAQSME